MTPVHAISILTIYSQLGEVFCSKAEFFHTAVMARIADSNVVDHQVITIAIILPADRHSAVLKTFVYKFVGVHTKQRRWLRDLVIPVHILTDVWPTSQYHSLADECSVVSTFHNWRRVLKHNKKVLGVDANTAHWL